jgi:hypothetical protein
LCADTFAIQLQFRFLCFRAKCSVDPSSLRELSKATGVAKQRIFGSTIGKFCSVVWDFFVVLVRAPQPLGAVLDAAQTTAAGQKMPIAMHFVAHG